MRFTLTIKTDVHEHSPRAHRQVIEHLLQQVQQAVGSGVAERGDITVPPHKVVGEWKMD
jgi:hypothetical protein